MSTFCDLSAGRCEPCEGIGAAMDEQEARELLADLPDWTLSDDARGISQEFGFRDFKDAMLFANAVGWMAEAQGHHPDMELGWGRVKVSWTTHALNGLSKNDFICAAKVQALAAR
ncbi:MAG: 4a-hydroxytetrahydrobiopterin dehydratase [Rhodocyclaceae bacterium]|nr:4a-hydroxytetrahydrobiopterin dehydratase [Rhodocyclaceae bacterium]